MKPQAIKATAGSKTSAAQYLIDFLIIDGRKRLILKGLVEYPRVLYNLSTALSIS